MQLKIYSDCFGKAGGKIFPQSVRLDDIKSLWYRETRARARQDAFSFLDMSGQRVFFWFQGSWQLRSFMSWFPWLEGNPIFFPPPLVFLVTGMQLASMSLLNVNSRAPQVGREKSHTHTHACTNKTGRCLQVEAKLLHLRHFLLAPITPTTSPPVRQIWQQSNLKKPNPCSKQEDASVSASWKFVSCEEKRV